MYSYHTIVAASNTDGTATLPLLAAVTMMQDASVLWLQGEPVLSEWLRTEHVAMMVASREVEIRRRPAFTEKLEVRTWIYKMASRMGWRNTCIFDESGQAVAVCWALGAFVSLESGHAVKLPRHVVESIAIEEPFPMEHGKRKVIVPDVPARSFAPVPVLRSDIDLNGHMNNAQYVRIATDLLPAGFTPTHMRIVHDGQAKLGDEVLPQRFDEGGTCYFKLANGQGASLATLEFS